MDTRRYSVFIGRFQPLHDGHKAIIQRLLDEGKRVAVCIRDTAQNEANPYTMGDRVEMFRLAYQEELEAEQVILIIFPDLTEIVYGRDVGYDIRETRFEAEIESISGSAIRANNLDRGEQRVGQDDAGEHAARGYEIGNP